MLIKLLFGQALIISQDAPKSHGSDILFLPNQTLLPGAASPPHSPPLTSRLSLLDLPWFLSYTLRVEVLE